MANICISVSDARLCRMLTILCREAGHTVGDTDTALLITDKKSTSPLPTLYLGEGGLSLPFSIPEFHERLSGLLCEGYAALTPTEKRLLDALRAASPSPVCRERLMLFAFDTEIVDGRLNLYIHYLRQKIEADGQKRIFACRGKGYYYAENTRR